MSWIDRLESIELEITTGDGKVYKPLWLNALKNINFNTEGFDFVGVPGTYVSRETQSGSQFPVTLYFQGENCIEDANAFEVSSADNRPWKIKHPFFDNLLVQPLDLQFDYSQYNIVKITGTLWKTIRSKYPEDKTDPADEIVTRKTSLDSLAVSYTLAVVPQPAVGLISPLGKAVTTIQKPFEKLARTAAEAKALKDKVRTVSGAISNIFNDLESFTNSLIDLINFPFIIAANIESSINGFIDAFNGLIGVFDTNDSQQQVFAEVSLTCLISAASAQLVNPGSTDFDTRADVVKAIDNLTALSDGLQTYFDDNSYIQASDLALQLDLIVNTAKANLFDIAFNAKQERSIILDKDSDPINLAHKYFGRGDQALDAFIKANNLSRSEYFEILKGRTITYYV